MNKTDPSWSKFSNRGGILDIIGHINSNGYFFKTGSQQMMGSQIFNTGSPLFQAVVLFHEIGHATDTLVPDRGNSVVSQQNTRDVLKNCKEALKGFADK